MKKVYEIVTFVLAGIIAGMIITIKWIAPPGQDITIGKIKVKGRNNTQSTVVEVDNVPSKREQRRQKRELRRNKKKRRTKNV